LWLDEISPKEVAWERGKRDNRSSFLTDNNINSIHHQVELLANEPEVSVVGGQDFLLASGASVQKL